MVDPDGLHVLAADIQDEADIRNIFFSRPGVGDGLNDMAFGIKSLVKEDLTIAGGADGKDLQIHTCMPVLAAHGQEGILGDL